MTDPVPSARLWLRLLFDSWRSIVGLLPGYCQSFSREQGRRLTGILSVIVSDNNVWHVRPGIASGGGFVKVVVGGIHILIGRMTFESLRQFRRCRSRDFGTIRRDWLGSLLNRGRMSART